MISDDESDNGDTKDDESDSSFPPASELSQLTRRDDNQSGTSLTDNEPDYGNLEDSDNRLPMFHGHSPARYSDDEYMDDSFENQSVISLLSLDELRPTIEQPISACASIDFTPFTPKRLGSVSSTSSMIGSPQPYLSPAVWHSLLHPRDEDRPTFADVESPRPASLDRLGDATELAQPASPDRPGDATEPP